jgi:hypothetical protein
MVIRTSVKCKGDGPHSSICPFCRPTGGYPIESPLKRSYRDDEGLTSSEVAMTFIQIIEITTTRPDEVESLVSEWQAKTAGRRTAQRGTFTQDRDRPNTYVQIVEFPSYDDAMANSDLPETASFAERMSRLCDGPMKFRNLDVRSVEEM